jgi:hypothetical protein
MGITQLHNRTLAELFFDSLKRDAQSFRLAVTRHFLKFFGYFGCFRFFRRVLNVWHETSCVITLQICHLATNILAL